MSSKRPLILLLALFLFGFIQAPKKDVRGLWLKRTEGSEFRFYYFHDGGIGLYRYGKRDLNHTNSFDYQVKDDRLHLTFRKTGEKHVIEFELKGDVLTLKNDPREPRRTRYRKVNGRLDAFPAGEHPFARMWTETKRYRTGGMGFRIYQFQGVDGRKPGNGWYHQGDYDDWSTESLEYRRAGKNLRLYFKHRKEHAVTPMRMIQHGDKRAIEMMSDPRNFWQRGRFVDGGKSIMLLDGLPAFVAPPP